MPYDDDRTLTGHEAAPDLGATALPVGTGLGEFVVVRVIGEGGFGIVYEAIDRTLQRHVAVKEFMPASLATRGSDGLVNVKSKRQRETFDSALRSFVNEARLLASFDHPALVKVHRFWEANGTAYMAMPLYDGTTLRDALRHAAEPPSQAMLEALLDPLTEGLQVLHAQQCFHRDIAPDNILLLAGSGAPLLLDFGAARRVIGDMTQALTVILKPGYAPIEQYAQTPGLQQGPWTDVYALAAVVYFAITGHTPPQAVGRLVDDAYEPLATVAAGRYSAGFLAAIDRALAVQPAQRTRSIDELRAQLGFASKAAPPDSGWARLGAAASAADDDATVLSASTPSGARRVALAAGAVAIGLGIAAALYFTHRGEPAATPTTAAAPPPAAASTPPEATPTPPPPAPAAATPPRDETAALPPPDPFVQALQTQTPGFDVRAASARSELRVNNDHLSFSVTSARDGHVQVMLREPDGTLLLLFPNALSSNNRIRAGKTLALPQSSWPLQAQEPAGPQRFLVVVSSEPRDYAAVTTQRKEPFAVLDAARLGAALAQGDYGAATFDVEIVR